MLKCRHLRVRVRAPRAAMMRRRQLALLPVLPLAVDPVHLLVEMQHLQGAEIKRIGRRRRRRKRRRRGRGRMKRGRRMSNLPLHQRTLGRRIQGRNPRGEGSLPSR
jgi:hypothetical protein